MTSILIVDDDLELCRSLSRCLASHGHEVDLAGSTDEAADRLASKPTDVLVADLRMEQDDAGLELIRRARRISPTTRSILMSAYASAKDHQAATALGAVAVLCKPFSSAELLSTVQKAYECAVGFRGSLYGLSLIDVLQMLHYGRRSVSLSVDGLIRGGIHFREGEIIHVSHGTLTGEDALRSLLAQTAGSMAAYPATADVPTTVTSPFQALLLDLLRLLDEGDFPSVRPTSNTQGTGKGDRVSITFFPPPLDADDADDAASSAAASDEARIAQRLDQLKAHVQRVVELMSGASSTTVAMFVNLAKEQVIPLRGEPLPTSEVIETTRRLVTALDRLEPGWIRQESFRGPVALGLVRCDDLGGYLMIADAFVGSFPVTQFRIQLSKLGCPQERLLA